MCVLALKVSGDALTVGRGEFTLGALEPVVGSLRGEKTRKVRHKDENLANQKI